MNKFGQKCISMLLALVMLFTMLPVTALAANQTVEITVLGKDGQPASGAWVNIYDLYNQNSNYVAGGQTDANGHVSLTFERKDDYMYSAWVSIGNDSVEQKLDADTSVYTVRFGDEEPSVPVEAYPVYIYVQVIYDGMPIGAYSPEKKAEILDKLHALGLAINAYGYFSIGSIAAVEGLPDPNNAWENTNYWNEYKDLLLSGTALAYEVDRLNINTAIDISNIWNATDSNIKLCRSYGANDFPAVNGTTWHLDGVVYFSSEVSDPDEGDDVDPPVVPDPPPSTTLTAEYQTMYYLMQTNGSYKLEETTTTSAVLGTTVHADVKPFPGYAVNVSNGTLTGTVTADPKLILEVYYDIANKYIIKFVDEDGTELQSGEVAYGVTPVYAGETPTKASDAQFTYTFAGWTPEIDAVTGDATYTATYTGKTRNYTVIWKNDNGTVLEIDESVPYGTIPEYNGALPAKDSTAQYTYIHSGWTPAVSAVTGDMTYIATYDAAKRNFAVTLNMLLDGEGVRIDAVRPEAESLGVSADGGRTVYEAEWLGTGVYVVPEVPNGTYNIYMRTGTGYEQICDQIIVVRDADAEKTCYYYSVTYDGNGAGNGVPEAAVYHLNKSVVVAAGTPEREGYVFKGWAYEGGLCRPGDLLTSGIAKPYELTAQWADAVDVKVNVKLDHRVDPTDPADGCDPDSDKDQVTIELVGKPSASASAWDEVDGTRLSLTADSDSDSHRYSCYPEGADSGEDYQIEISEYTASGATYSDLEGGDWVYTVTATKAGYDVTSVKAEKDENGDWTVNVVLQYAPDSFELEFSVEMDEDVPEELYPDAVITRVLYWDGDSWEIITQQNEGKPGVRVEIDPETGKGSGSYSVWKYDGDEAYGYRFEVSSFDYGGGNFPYDPADSTLTAYTDGTYVAEMEDVTNGETYGTLKGAFYDEDSDSQQGTLNAVISRNAYAVTFDANGGQIDGQTEKRVSGLYAVPSFGAYKPTHDGSGYIFDGWYADAACTVAGEEGTALTGDVTLYAKWRKLLTVSGDISVAGTYTLDGETKTIQDADRIREVSVVLQYASAGSSIFFDMREAAAQIVYTGDTGTGSYEFTDVPESDGTWRVHILGRNYTTEYKNETVSDYGSETADPDSPGTAKDVNPEDAVANVDIRMEFSPRNFDLYYKVDAADIGEGFRPAGAGVLVLYNDEVDPGRSPQEWPVISQMQTGGTAPNFTYKGEAVAVGGEASYSVWRYHPGEHLYDYAIRLQDVDGKALTGAEPYTVSYNGSAFYLADGGYRNQTRLLVAKLTPKTYSITYELGTGGSWPEGTSPATSHTWSKETAINVIPVRAGYVFDGWTADVSGAYADGRITAATAQDVTLTANWSRIEDIIFTGESGAVIENGSLQSLSDITVTGLPEGYTYEGLTYSAEGTAAGSYSGSFRGAVKIWNGNEDVTNRFRFVLIPGTLVIKADANGDQVPDDRQKKITFKVINGLWSETGTDERVEYIDLDTDGNGTLTLPVDMQPNPGYANGAWDGGEPGTAVSGAEDQTYTYRYRLIDGLSYTVNYLEAGTDRVLAPAKTQGGVLYGETVTADSQKIDITGYLYDSASVRTLTIGTGENILNLYYRQDESATKTLRYVVKHLLDGMEQVQYTATYEETVWVNAPDVLTVVEGSLKAKVFGGYRYVSTENAPAGSVIANGTVVILNYSKVPVTPDPPAEPIEPGTGSVTLTKVDSRDRSTTLANVVFTLCEADGTKVGTYRTGADGTVTVRNLPAGEYYWIEVRPAEGYMLDTSRHVFRVSGGKTAEISISNTRTPVPAGFSGDHYGYVIGFSDGRVHPEANITRAQVATIFFRLLDEETRAQYMCKSSKYRDVSEDMWCNTAVSTLSAMGIINGYADGNFYPNASITRAQFAAIAARFDAAGNTTGDVFSDVSGHWAKREIHAAYNNGWILGYSDGTFRPDRNITRAEAITMINRVLQRVPEHKDDLLAEMVQWPDNMDPSAWYYLAIQEATNSHDYGRKKNGYEFWTVLKEVRDWSELER